MTATDPDSLLAMMQNRRSVRTGYREDKPVSDQDLRLVLEAGRAAPSAGNGQPWEFIVIREKETRHAIADLFKKQLQDKLELERTIRGKASVGGSVGYRFAPVHILQLGDPRTALSFPLRTQEEKADSHFFSSLANSLLQMMLMAESLGLSTQYVSDVSSPYFSLMLKHMLGIPRDLRVYHLMPLGYSEEKPEASARRPLEAMVHWERYDPAKERSQADVERFVAQGTIQSTQYNWGASKKG